MDNNCSLMEISKIRYFLTVYEAQGLRKASELLNISPSAVSKGLGLLEEELGKKFFVSSGRGIQPTQEADFIYPYMKNFYRHFEDLEGILHNNTAPLTRRLRIASWEIFSSYFVSQLIRQEFNEFPMEVLERAPGQIEEALIKNEVDFGITYAPVPLQGVDHIKITKIKYGLYGRANKFNGKKLEDLPFSCPITKISGSPTGIKSLDNWPAEIDRQTLFQFELLETALEAARDGTCVLFCPSFVIRLQNQKLKSEYLLEKIITSKKIPNVSRDIYIAKRSDLPENSEMKKLAKVLRKVCP